MLAGQEVPLILAATEPLSPTLRNVLSHPHVAPQIFPGSPDQTPDHDLAAAARAVLDGVYAAGPAALADLYALRENQGRVSTDIAAAARAGDIPGGGTHLAAILRYAI